MTNLIFHADWHCVLKQLPLLLRPGSAILEIDRMESAIPSGWRMTGTSVRLAPPLDYARQFSSVGLPLESEPDDVSWLGFVASADIEEVQHSDPLSRAVVPGTSWLRGRTLDTLASGIGDVGMLIFGGVGARTNLVGAALATLAHHKAPVVFRLSEGSSAAPDLLAELKKVSPYQTINAADLALESRAGRWAETIMIAVPDPWGSEGIASLVRAPHNLVTHDSGASAERRPFAYQSGSRYPGRGHWLLSPHQLRSVRGLGHVEQDETRVWRWSQSRFTTIYAEVPSPGEYCVTISVPFYISDRNGITAIAVNGCPLAFTHLEHTIEFDVELFRHMIIDVDCAVIPAGGNDPRSLGYGLGGLHIRRLAVG